jgi:hypothetical protein
MRLKTIYGKRSFEEITDKLLLMGKKIWDKVVILEESFIWIEVLR